MQKGVLMEELTEKMGARGVPQIYLKKARSSGSFFRQEKGKWKAPCSANSSHVRNPADDDR